MKNLLISDYSYNEIKGGAEIVDKILIEELELDFCKSQFFTSGDGYDKIILSNSWELNPKGRKWLVDNGFNFKIEHDYQCFPKRIPEENVDLVNIDLYQAAKKVIFQSTFQENIFKKVFDIENCYTVGGSLWKDEDLAMFKSLRGEKNGRALILEGAQNKGFEAARQLSEYFKVPVDILQKCEYDVFIRKLSEYNCVFIQSPIESLCRVAVEARMLGVIPLGTPGLAAAYEPWWNKDRFEIIEEMRKRKSEFIKFLKT